MLLTDELVRLPETVARLVEGQATLFEGQAKLEETVARLVEGQAKLFEGQAKLEEIVARLVEGQAKLFEGQAKLEAAVERLDDGQQRLEVRVGRLEDGLAALRKEVGGLSNTIGGTAEEDAIDVLCYMARQRGYELDGEPTAVDLDGDGELDLWVRARDSEGKQMSLLVEAKVRLRAREVRTWAAQVADPEFQASLERAGIAGPYVAYAFGIRIYAEARETARAVGMGLLSVRGEDLAPTDVAVA